MELLFVKKNNEKWGNINFKLQRKNYIVSSMYTYLSIKQSKK